MKKIILFILLISSYCFAINIRCISETKYDKQINDNSGLELTILRGTIALNDDLDFKFGLSQQYTGFRSSPFSFNHFGDRVDVGFAWRIPGTNFKAGYTHSIRNRFSGASPVDLYDTDSVDSAYFRYEFDLEVL